MTFNRKNIVQFLSSCAICMVLLSCNSKSYQNITAKFNGHYYAQLRLSEVEQALDDAYQYNYNDILKIYPDIDSAVIQSNEAKLDDAFTKASRLVEWHSASDYVDDGYLIAGKIRHLRGQFQEAIQTLQYVNQISTDKDAKHAALVALMRTYMDMDEMENATQVSEFLESADLSEENKADFRLTMAYFHQRQNNLQGIAQNLNEVSDIIKDRDEKSRSKFILGQIYQRLGFNTEAYDFYKASLAGNPPYELSFYARLNMQQVADFGSEADNERIRKFYQALLKDGKNTEYRSNIYFEMGEFELKQSHHDLALNNYLLSVTEENPPQRIQGLSFLRAGQLYFDHYQNFRLAKAYYDSTIAVLPKDIANYEGIQKRQGVLNEFVTQLDIIHRNDSLLSLSEMSQISLDAFVENYLNEKEEKEKAKAKDERQNQSNSGVNRVDDNPSTFDPNNSGTWYFYNTAALDQGQIEFERTWGNRPLEDNWRRSSKERSQASEASSDTSIDPDPTSSKDTKKTPKSQEREAEKAKILESIPQSEEEKEQLHLEMQEAYFKLGGVYQYGLEKIDDAVISYQTLVDRYRNSEFRPDALMALYGIFLESDPARAEAVKSQIIADYPETVMAKMLINPNYLIEKEQRNQQLQQIYANAYKQFEAGNYRNAERMLQSAYDSLEDVDFLPNAQLLLAIMKARTENLFSYEQALKEFIKQYPTGELSDYAQNLLNGIDPVKSNIVRTDDFEYSEDFEQLHIISLLYDRDSIDEAKLRSDIDAFNSFLHSSKNLTLGVLEFDKETNKGVLFVNSFKTKELAQAYGKELAEALGRFGSTKGKDLDSFVISRDNFQMLIQSKKVEEYRVFHKRFYQ